MESDGGQKSQAVAGRAGATAMVVLREEIVSTTAFSQGQFQIDSSEAPGQRFLLGWALWSPFQALCGLCVGSLRGGGHLFCSPPDLGLC